MLNDAQEYGIKNKENIRKPSRDGYEANSTLTSKYKNMQAYIDGAKQKTLAKPAPTAAVKEEAVAEPTKRTAKKNAEPAAKKDFADVINSWASDDDA
jgi:hypothetical protein